MDALNMLGKEQQQRLLDARAKGYQKKVEKYMSNQLFQATPTFAMSCFQFTKKLMPESDKCLFEILVGS